MAEYQVVKYRSGKLTFELLTKPGTVLKFRKGLITSLDNVIMSDEIWLDHRKGTRASASDLVNAFNTDKPAEIARIIVQNGDLELSAAERKEAIEKKRAEIVNYIHKYYMNPQTKTPHPVTRIQNALEQLKVRIDPDAPTEKQVQDIVKRLPEVMPIRKSEMEGTITVPHKYLGQAAGIIKKFASIRGESYSSTGCTYEVSFVPGDYQPLLQEIQKVTNGEVQFDVAGGALAATTEEESKGKGKPARGGKAKRGK